MEASKRYFLNLRGEQRYFFLFIALFSDVFNEEKSKSYLEDLFSLYALSPADLNIRLIREDVRYVRQWGKLGFEHQDYLDGAFEAIRDETFTEDISRLREFLEDISKDTNPDIRQAACFALRELARVKPKEALPIVLKLLHSEDRQVVESAFVPLRYLVVPYFDEVSPHFEKWINMREINKSDPNYKWIIFGRVVRDYLIGFYIDSDDVNGFTGFISKYRISLDLRGKAILKLKDTWKIDSNKARNFFAKWYEEQPNDALRGIEETIASRWERGGRGMTSPVRNFMVDMLDSIPSEKAIEVIVKWSKTETKREDFRKNFIGVVLSSLQRLVKKNPNRVSTLLEEWRIKGEGIQKNVAESWYFLEFCQF